MTKPILLLDGAMGTELAARGFELVGPLYSARALLEAPALVATIHRDYLRAGAQVLTTNSFGLHARTLAKAGVAELQGPLLRRSVELLERVRAHAFEQDRSLARFRIAGSIPPRPEADSLGVDEQRELAIAEYRGFAQQLARAGADLLLLETFPSIGEAELALAGLVGIDLPIWLSVVANSRDGTRLIAGDSLAELEPMLDRTAATLGIELGALLINCTQIDAVPAALDALARVSASRPELPLGLSPHFGRRGHDGVWIERIIPSDVFAEQMHLWLVGNRHARPGRARFELAGACCGSTPADIASLRARLQPEPERAWVRLAELIP